MNNNQQNSSLPSTCAEVLAALPENISADFEIFGPYLSGHGAEYANVLTTFIYAHPLLDWDRYLEMNPDVRAAGVDPVRHFIDFGAHEGRKAYAIKDPRCERNGQDSAANGAQDREPPKVSVICVNYNNEIFLEKALFSLATQTLKEIEIIFVDDGSQDGSLAIAENFARNDPRFKIIPLKTNRSTHMARKIGVAAATGEYVMFLDSDDSYQVFACERAYEAISQGYDIVVFNANVINRGNLPQREIRERENWYNSLKPGLYVGDEKLHLAYKSGKLPHFLWSKIFRRTLAQESFAASEDGEFRLLEDQYEFLLLVSRARNLYKIDERLVNYVVGKGITSCQERKLADADLFLYSAVLPPLEKYCRQNLLFTHAEHERRFMLRCSFELIPNLAQSQITRYFDGLKERFGELFVASHLMDAFWGKSDVLARCVKHYEPAGAVQDAPVKLGVLCWGAPGLNDLKMFGHIKQLMAQRGVACAFFIEAPLQNDNPVLDAEEVYCLQQHGNWQDQEHLRSLCQGARQARITHMLFLDVARNILLYDTILLKLLGIKVSGLYREEFIFEFLRKQQLNISKFHKNLECLDVLGCADHDSSLYLAAHGIDALPIFREEKFAAGCFGVNREILVIGSSDPNLDRTLECLPYFRQLLKEIPDLRFTIVDNFCDAAKLARIRTRAQQLKISAAIHIAHFENDLSALKNSIGAIFSASSLHLDYFILLDFPGLPIFELGLLPADQSPMYADLALQTLPSRQLLAFLNNTPAASPANGCAPTRLQHAISDDFPQFMASILKADPQKTQGIPRNDCALTIRKLASYAW